MAGRFGGTEVDNWQEYEKEDQSQYFNKGGHRERSLFWSPRHGQYWKKEEKKQ